MSKYQSKKRGDLPKKIQTFYLSTKLRQAVDKVRGALSFSAYVSSALLKAAEQDGVVFYGEVRGGTCTRASPEREGCATGLPASWWNTFCLTWFCEPCARAINAGGSGRICLSPEEQRGDPGPPPPPPPPSSVLR